MLKKLIAINNNFGLIKTIEDVEFLFFDYKIDESLSLEQQIDNSLKWAYHNDDFEDFFGEHIDSLYQSDILTLIVECSMEYETDGQKYDLYQFESKSKYFYFVDGHDDYVHETMFSVEKDKHDVKSIISDFENEFYDNICLDGEFSLEELLEKGVSININIYLGK
jgi:hypothetical protein